MPTTVALLNPAGSQAGQQFLQNVLGHAGGPQELIRQGLSNSTPVFIDSLGSLGLAIMDSLDADIPDLTDSAVRFV